MKTFRLRCVVLEDEDDIREWLVERLKEYPELEVIGEATNIDDAYRLILTTKPDVAFMDIQLIGGDAFNLLSKLQNNGLPIPYIVMATGYPEFVMTALNDYRRYVVQYLTKPFVENFQAKFRKAIDALMAAKMKDLPSSSDSKKEIVHTENEPPFTFLQSKGSLIRIDFDKIAYLEAAGKGESIVVFDNKLKTVDLTLAKFMKLLPNYFIRISRSNIVNINRVISIDRGDRTAMILRKPKNKELGVSDHYYNDFLQQLPLAKDRLLDNSIDPIVVVSKNNQIYEQGDKATLIKGKVREQSNSKKQGIVNIKRPQNGGIGDKNLLTFLFLSINNPLKDQQIISSDSKTKIINSYNQIFGRYGIAKNKTTSDSNNDLYTFAGDHPKNIISAALEIQEWMIDQSGKNKIPNKPFLELRVGIHSDIVRPTEKRNKKDYDENYNDIKNIAKSIEKISQPGEVTISSGTWKFIRKEFSCRFSGTIETNDGQEIEIYTVRK